MTEEKSNIGANSTIATKSVDSVHSYVDLALPSGTRWATMNIGAEKETDYGLYFAWGETQGYFGKNSIGTASVGSKNT